MLIEKHDLPYEKLKQVTHPSGKKFMGLILEIINIAIKEMMIKRFRNVDCDKSLDIEATKLIKENMHKMETELFQQVINTEAQIKERTVRIQDLLHSIQQQQQQDEHFANIEFEEFIEMWFKSLKNRSDAIKKKNLKMNQLIQKARDIYDKAQKMMRKDFELLPASKSENYDVHKIIDHISSLPAIAQFIENYPVDSSKQSTQDSRLLAIKTLELQQLQNMVKSTSEKCKMLSDLRVKTCTAFETSRILDDDDNEVNNSTERDVKWKFYTFSQPSYKFDASKKCINFVDIKDPTSLVFCSMKNSIITRADATDQITSSNRMDLHKTDVFKIPNQKQPLLPSRRRRRVAIDILDQAISTAATSSKHQSSMYMDQILMIPRTTASSTPFSSTMLSPDMNRNNFGFNLSVVSEISVLSQKQNKNNEQIKYQYSKNQKEELKQCGGDNNYTPEIKLIEATLDEEKLKVGEEDKTICNKENFKNQEEDLFNVSDSCLIPEY